MKLKIEFGFGIEFRGDGSAILGHEQAAGISDIRRRATTLFGGHTLFNTLGEWRDPDTGSFVAEEGCMISVLIGTADEEGVGQDIDLMVRQIKDSLKQKAVCVTLTNVTSSIF